MNAPSFQKSGFSLEKTIGHIDRAETAFGIFKQLKATGAAFDLPKFLVTISPTEALDHFSRRAIITNWDQDLLAFFVENDNWSRMELTRRLLGTDVPVSVRISDLVDDDGQEEQAGLRAMIGHGIDRKAFFPVRTASHPSGAVSFADTRGPVSAEEMAVLFLVARHAFARLMEIRHEGEPLSPLTDREAEILALFATGMTAGQAGKEIGVTSHTVNFHTANIVRKLGARNKVHAIVIALKKGWLSPRVPS